MKKAILLLSLLGTALTASACVVAPYPGYRGGGGWCYYHPYRCY